MPKLSYNLDDLPDQLGVPAGRYRAKLVSCVKEKSKSSGNAMLTWTWKITSGKAKGQTVKSWTSLSEGALANLKNHLTAFGLKGKVSKSTDALIGQTVTLIIVERASTQPGREGEKFSNVARILPKNAPMKDEEPDEDEDEDSDSDEDDDDFDEDDEDDEDSDDDEDEDEDEDADEDDEDEDDEDEDDEEEDERPRNRTRKSASKKPKPTAKKKSRR